MGATETLLGVAGWAFLPDYATRLAVQYLHKFLFQYFQIVPPQPGSPQYRKHYRYTFAVAVLGYLLYTLIQSARSMQPSFYELMNVRPNVDEAGLKQAFRQFARKYHPDRIGPQGEGLFIIVRDAFEALKNPVVRYAYDRFGPDVLLWTDCTTPREYLRRGLTQSVGFHIFSLVGILFWSAMGTTPLPFWRYTIYAACFALELSIIVNPSPASGFLTDPSLPPSSTSFFHSILPSRVQYQHIQYLHQILVFLNIALARVAPRLFPDDTVLNDAVLVKNLKGLIELTNRQSSVILRHELASIQSPRHPIADSLKHPEGKAPAPRELVDELVKEMENLIIESNLKKESGPLKSAWDKCVEQGRRGFSISSPSKAPNGSLPSPVSPPGTPKGLSPRKQGRPSLPMSRSPSYVRGRSISY